MDQRQGYSHGDTGLYYYRARMYSPELGRFLQPDPIGYADGMNVYVYCGNNPINWIDPWGLYGAGTRVNPNNKPGHTDLGNGYDMGFRYDRLDYGFWSSPFNPITGTGRHFRSREEIAPDIERAIREGNRQAFEEYMHEWQDSFVHYDNGYRWPFGHFFDGHAPDDPANNPGAWREADRTPREWEERRNQRRDLEDLAKKAEKWMKMQEAK
jgi:RHS repeat-associated protein